MKAMEALAREMPAGIAGEWAGSSLQEKASESQLPGLIVPHSPAIPAGISLASASMAFIAVPLDSPEAALPVIRIAG